MARYSIDIALAWRPWFAGRLTVAAANASDADAAATALRYTALREQAVTGRLLRREIAVAAGMLAPVAITVMTDAT